MYSDLKLKLCYHLLLAISVFPLQSDATSIIQVFRQLATESKSLANPQTPLEIPPSPSPSPAFPAPVDLPNKGLYVTTPNAEPVVTDTCDRIIRTCHLQRVTACLGVKGSMLIVLNDDSSSLKVKVTILPVNVTYKELDIPRHQGKKINISDSVGGASSILLEDGNGKCTFDIDVVPKDNISLQFSSVDAYITPVNALLVLVLIIGGAWTCFKFVKRRTHPQGVPYQQLEIGHLKLVSSVNVESAQGWDQVWDDNWDEEKGVSC